MTGICSLMSLALFASSASQFAKRDKPDISWASSSEFVRYLSLIHIFGAVADEVVDFLKGATMVSHNSSFDTRMLDAELSRAKKPVLEQLGVTVIDTLAVARNVYPLIPKHNLNALCEHLNINLDERELHGATIDIRLLGSAFPKMATDYDRWMAIVEDSCGAELDNFERELLFFYNELIASGSHSAPEAVDGALSRIGTALRSVERQRAALLERCSGLVGTDDWCCKHFFTRWDTSERISWKSAVESLIPTVDLAPYKEVSVSETVTPKTAVDVEAALNAVGAPLASESVTSSIHCIARAVVILADAERSLAAERQSLREELLTYARLGYAPAQCSVRSTSRTTIDYEQACSCLLYTSRCV